MSPDPTIHIVDDDLDVCRSLTLLLRTAGFHAKPYLSAAQLLADADTAAPGVVVTDVRMPHIDGMEFLHRWQAAGRGDPVILITGHADVPLAVRAIKAGAFTFIQKPFTQPEIVAAIVDATAGATPRPSADGRQDGTAIDRLSKREMEVFRALVHGSTNKRIARDLGISPRTVELHRAHLMAKMDVRNLPALVRIGIEAGIDRTQ